MGRLVPFGAVPLTKLLGNIGAIILCLGVAVILVVFTFGINLSEWIHQLVEEAEERKEERKTQRDEWRKQMAKEEREKPMPHKREKEDRRMKKAFEKQEKAQMEEQIKINFGGTFVDNLDEKVGLKKYDHSQDDLEPLTKQSKLLSKQKMKKAELTIDADETEKIEEPEMQPDVIENNLFKDVEEQKEEKTKAVLQLEHAMTVEDEHYEYPPIEILSKSTNKKVINF